MHNKSLIVKKNLDILNWRRLEGHGTDIKTDQMVERKTVRDRDEESDEDN